MISFLDGKKTRDDILKNIKSVIDDSRLKLKLVVVSIGNDYASKLYINNKKRACEKCGIQFENVRLFEDEKEVIKNKQMAFEVIKTLINELNKDKSVTGIIIQSPIKGLEEYEDEIFNLVLKNKDVDAFGDEHIVDLYRNQDYTLSCTPFGIMSLLSEKNISVEGKHVVIVGRSNIVGKPLALAMLNENATVTICHSKTKNLKAITRQADILVSAVGKAKMIDATYVKDSVEAIIDVGMNRDENGKLCGDVDIDSIIERWDFQEKEIDDTMTHYITPVPGGVGPMTVASLMTNVLKLGVINIIEEE